jgi:hypothetical protein
MPDVGGIRIEDNVLVTPRTIRVSLPSAIQNVCRSPASAYTGFEGAYRPRRTSAVPPRQQSFNRKRAVRRVLLERLRSASCAALVERVVADDRRAEIDPAVQKPANESASVDSTRS